MEFKHTSVLLDETIEQLKIRPDGIYVDGTLGGAGHSLEICRRLRNGRLVGIDQDADAIAAATKRMCSGNLESPRSMASSWTWAYHPSNWIRPSGDLPIGWRMHL